MPHYQWTFSVLCSDGTFHTNDRATACRIANEEDGLIAQAYIHKDLFLGLPNSHSDGIINPQRIFRAVMEDAE